MSLLELEVLDQDMERWIMGDDECVAWGYWASFKEVLWLVGSVLPGVSSTALASHRDARDVGPSIEPGVGNAVWGYWAGFKKF